MVGRGREVVGRWSGSVARGLTEVWPRFGVGRTWSDTLLSEELRSACVISGRYVHRFYTCVFLSVLLLIITKHLLI